MSIEVKDKYEKDIPNERTTVVIRQKGIDDIEVGGDQVLVIAIDYKDDQDLGNSSFTFLGNKLGLCNALETVLKAAYEQDHNIVTQALRSFDLDRITDMVKHDKHTS